MEYQPFNAKFRLLRIPYYIHSFFVLFRELEPQSRFQFVRDLFFLAGNKTIYLKKGLIFKLKSLLDILTLKEVVLDDEYQNNGVRITDKDRIIVDIGAGFGDFSIMVAKKFPKTKIYVFEPESEYYSLLVDNLSVNQIKNVMSYHKAIHNLSDIFRITNAKKIDFLKMDCEGCEFNIFNNQSIQNLRYIKKIILEYHEDKNNRVNSLIKIFRRNNFQTVIYPSPRKGIPNLGLLVSIRKGSKVNLFTYPYT